MLRRTNDKGFTLIELLIVIVIIGILAGIVLSVINPAQQQAKAREAVLRSNVNKVCLAMFACANTQDGTAAVAACDTHPELGTNDPSGTPTGSSYAFTAASPNLTVSGTLGACTYECSINTATGVSTPTRVRTGTTCFVQ